MSAPSDAPIIAVLGLGEAGALIAADLAVAGARVCGFDPRIPVPEGIEQRDGDADAVRDADLVISLTTAEEAEAALLGALPGLRPGTLWADANTAAPSLKLALSEIATRAGVEFADVALMAPVPGKGLLTPMLVSGTGAERCKLELEALGAAVDLVDGPPGTANSRKLLRSVVYKGIAAAVVEALEGARLAGCEEWFREHLAAEFASFDAQTVERLVSGTLAHARRRAEEMDAATRQLQELGLDPRIAPATREALERLSRQRDAPASAHRVDPSPTHLPDPVPDLKERPPWRSD